MTSQTPRLQITCSQEIVDKYNKTMTGEQKKLFRDIVRKTMDELSKMSTEELRLRANY